GARDHRGPHSFPTRRSSDLDTSDAALVLAALTTMLARAPALTAIDLGANSKGRNDLDAALAVVIAAGPWPHLQALSLHCTRHHRSEEHTSELQSRENLVCRL